MQQITHITIDVGRVNSLPSIVPAKQGDTGRVIQATVTDKGVSFDMTGATAIARIHKPDGTNCLYDEGVTVEGNTVVVPLVDQALTAHGRARGEINLYTSAADRITTFDFWIDIEKSTVADGEIVSSDYYNALTQTAAQILATNTMVKPVGFYDSFSDLMDAVSSPTIGDMYGVGTAAPYDYYVWSGEAWVNNGQIGASGIPYLGKTSGSAAAFTIDYTGAIGNGQPFVFMPHADGHSGATLKIGANPAYPILNHDGTAVDENMLYAFVPIVAIYRAASADAEAAYIVTLDGTTGAEGEAGKAATIQVGTVTTGAAGTAASVVNVGNENAAIFDFAIPAGATGKDGEDGQDGKAATIQIGSVTTGEPGSDAQVSNGGSENAAVFNFVIPRGQQGKGFKVLGYYATLAALKSGVLNPETGDTYGVGTSEPYDIYIYDSISLDWVNNGPLQGAQGDKGDAATVTVGSTTTGEPGTQANVTNSGTNKDAVLNFTIPAGKDGKDGEDGYTPVKGKDYFDGEDGAAATITIGTVTTGAAGTNASVTNSGTSNAAKLNFTIPRGEAGQNGEDGKTPVRGTDYWTAEDRAAIVSDVLDALPTWNGGSY